MQVWPSATNVGSLLVTPTAAPAAAQACATAGHVQALCKDGTKYKYSDRRCGAPLAALDHVDVRMFGAEDTLPKAGKA